MAPAIVSRWWHQEPAVTFSGNALDAQWLWIRGHGLDIDPTGTSIHSAALPLGQPGYGA